LASSGLCLQLPPLALLLLPSLLLHLLVMRLLGLLRWRLRLLPRLDRKKHGQWRAIYIPTLD
jgi:hypothetical protein